MNAPPCFSGRRPRLFEQRHHHVPPGTGTLGMVLFLIALGMLFGASLLGYLIIRLRLPATIHLPGGLWVSTALMLTSSYTIHRALQNVRHERQTPFRKALVVTLLLAVGFLLVQAPSLTALLREHGRQLADGQGVYLHALVFFLILLHAAHLVGGLIPLAVVSHQAHAGRYDHEHHAPVWYLALYWHFLDGVWVTMFLAFRLTAS